METNMDLFKPIYFEKKKKYFIKLFLILKSKLPKCLIKYLFENLINFPEYYITRLIRKYDFPFGNHEKFLWLNLNTKKTHIRFDEVTPGNIAVYRGLFNMINIEYYTLILNLLMEKNLINFNCADMPIFEQKNDQRLICELLRF